jgi:hypothetical protein
MNNSMIRKLKNIASILLLFVFLFPSIIKLEHQHEQFICKAKSEKHYHIFHEKCGICMFEFSAFSSDIEKIDLQKEKSLTNYCNNYRSVSNINSSPFSFLLRAPPFEQI